MIVSRWLWAASGLGLLGALGGLDRIAVHMIRPPYKPLRRRAQDLPYPHHPLKISSGREVLSGWLVEPAEDVGGAVLVLAHGWGSNHGTMTRLAEPLLQAGYPVFLFDARHHGESRGAPYITARHFRDDIMAMVREAASRFPQRPLALIGHSMGGSTGILAVAEGAPVHALVTIGAPGDLWDVWAYHLSRKGIPGRWVVRALSPFWRLRAGVPWRTLDPTRRAPEINVPFLVIHGENDESVAIRHAALLGRAGRTEPLILAGQGHTDLLDDPRLHDRIRALLESLVP